MQGKPKVISLHTAPLAEERRSFAPHSICTRTSAVAEKKCTIPVTTQQPIGGNRFVVMEPTR